MKNTIFFIFIVSCLLSFRCTKENKTNDTDITCNDIFIGFDKPVTDGGKGWILFSWQENNKWNYSIVINLNISPANERISENNIMYSDSCVKYNLDSFAEEVNLYWYGNGETEIMNNTVKLAYPPNDIRNNIIEFCRQKNIDLIIE